MTKPTIEEIKARWNKATSGPWSQDEEDACVVRCAEITHETNDGWGRRKSDNLIDEPLRAYARIARREDADFIAHSWTDISFLLEQVRDWESDYKDLREAVRKMEGYLPPIDVMKDHEPDVGIFRDSDENISAMKTINEHLEFDFLAQPKEPSES